MGLIIGFRCDGGTKIGMGHIFRCASLAKELEKQGANVFFITRGTKGATKLKEWGFSVEEISVDGGKEPDIVINILKKNKAEAVVTDSYDIDQEYLERLKAEGFFVVTIDDLNRFPFSSDIVINQNLFGKEMNYRTTKNTKFLIGPKYAMLREQFSKQTEKEINKKVKNVLVSTGGTDNFNITPTILKALSEIKEIEITVVIGPAFKNEYEITETAKKFGNRCKILKNVDNLYDSLLKADIAITGGGTMLYELAATGTPGLTIIQAENQIANAKTMEKYGTIKIIGKVNEISEEKIRSVFKELAADFKKRKKMSEKGRELIDGKGSSRVASIIIKSLEERLKLRPANLNDCKIMWEWRNDPETRKVSFNTEPIPFDEHKEWFYKSLKDPSRHIYIIMLENKKVGVVRLDVNNSEAEIHINIAPDSRGMGIGPRAIKRACEKAFELGVKRIKATIKPENKASISAFSKAGFIVKRKEKTVEMEMSG
jgi:UDP-2,4-diacetamido-2,4,6-trideoxy-beta-L-altropyranose hydrolase